MVDEHTWRPYRRPLFRPSFILTILFAILSIISFIVGVDMSLKYNRCKHSDDGNESCDNLQTWKNGFFLASGVFILLFAVHVVINLKGKSFSYSAMERGYYEDEEEYLNGESEAVI